MFHIINRFSDQSSLSQGLVFRELLVRYRIYLNMCRSAYLIFRATSAALIRGRGLFKHCTRQMYFFYVFIQRYTFYLLIFQWTDTKLIVNLELRANSFVVVERFTTFSQFRCHCLLLYQNLRAPAWEGKPLPHLNLCTRISVASGVSVGVSSIMRHRIGYPGGQDGAIFTTRDYPPRPARKYFTKFFVDQAYLVFCVFIDLDSVSVE